MIKRGFIRSFFIGSLVVCVGAWVESYWRAAGVEHYGSSGGWDNTLILINGKMHFYHTFVNGVSFRPLPSYRLINEAAQRSALARGIFGAEGEQGFLGFGFERGIDDHAMVPLWFPSALSVLLLWPVYRKTRQKTAGRAFPVEASNDPAKSK